MEPIKEETSIQHYDKKCKHSKVWKDPNAQFKETGFEYIVHQYGYGYVDVKCPDCGETFSWRNT